MRKDIVAMKIMEMVFQHNFGWGREGNLINLVLLSQKKKKKNQKKQKEFHHRPLGTAHIRVQWIL